MSNQLNASHLGCCRFRNPDDFLIRNAYQIGKHLITNTLSEVIT